MNVHYRERYDRSTNVHTTFSSWTRANVW